MVDTRAVEGTGVELRFTVLGGSVGVTQDGTPISLGGAQQRRLLAALLAEGGGVVSADRYHGERTIRVQGLGPVEERAPFDARA